MVLFLRCNEVVFDSRAMKYLKFYRNKNIDFRIIGWDRQGNAHGAPEDSIYFMRRTGFNVGGFTAMINRILWMLFLIKTLVRNCMHVIWIVLSPPSYTSCCSTARFASYSMSLTGIHR